MSWAALPETKQEVFRGVFEDYEKNPQNAEAKSRAARVAGALTKNGMTDVPEDIAPMMAQFAQPTPTPTPTPSPVDVPGGTVDAGGTAEPSNIIGKTASTFMGAAEAFNPLSIPRAVETLGRGVGKWAGSEKPTGEYGKDIFGNPIPLSKGKGFLQSLGEASEESVMPRMTFRSLGEAVHGKETMSETLPEGYEMAGGLATMLLPMGKGAMNLLKGSKGKQATKLLNKTAKQIKYLTGMEEGAILDEILSNPQAIKALYSGGGVKADDLAAIVVTRLKDVESKLGKSVQQYKNVAETDKTRRIFTAQFKQQLKDAVTSAALEPEIKLLEGMKKSKILGASGEPMRVLSVKKVKIGGGTSLEPSDMKVIDEVMNMMDPKAISPRDTLLAIERLDKAIEWGKETQKHSTRAINVFKNMRHTLKNVVRKTTDDGKAWAHVDDVLHDFYENSKGLVKKFEGDQRVGQVNNLLNEVKDPVRLRLGKAMDAVGQAFPSETDVAHKFFRMLSQRKGAKLLKDVEIQRGDRAADQVNRIFKDWVDKGKAYGIAIGTGTGTLIGHKMGGWLGGAALSAPGAAIGNLTGRIVGATIGKRAGDPLRMFAKIEKANILSQEAKQIAKDLKYLHKIFGAEGANIAASLAMELPAMKELTRFAVSQAPSSPLEITQGATP